MGDPAAALADCEAAMPGAVLDREASMMRLARSTMLIAGGGDLGEELGRLPGAPVPRLRRRDPLSWSWKPAGVDA